MTEDQGAVRTAAALGMSVWAYFHDDDARGHRGTAPSAHGDVLDRWDADRDRHAQTCPMGKATQANGRRTHRIGWVDDRGHWTAECGTALPSKFPPEGAPQRNLPKCRRCF